MKRVFDIVMSLLGLIVLSPVFLILGICICKDSSGGVFFRGPRIGKNGKIFHIFKFRSMVSDAEGKGKWNVGDNDQRITGIGHFLRNTKLDEIPQLINILFGDMSFVGPRPELKYYVDMYTEREKPILDLRPGMTDWASMVNIQQFKAFTEAKDPDEFYLKQVRPLKLQLQLYYRYHHGFFSDVLCILWTIYKVVTHSKVLPATVQEIVEKYRRDSIV